jgi:glycine cleavage system transcriptional repressor
LATELTITAVGRDRPGIVAGLTAALLPIGANLHECRAALLHGSFAMVMAVEVPDTVDIDAARAAIAPTASALGLEVQVGAATTDAASATGERCVLSVYGADHPGIVHATSSALAALDVNILDLSSRVVGDPPVYVLGIEVALPVGVDLPTVEAALAPVAATQRVELHLEREVDDLI